ncbi:glycosyltransferase family 8 protein [Shinella sumterensis]|uniref:glycosyltransferase family 8 protein n=1 Tax=Shinella sumterensis TaxID=1967501 RepID=UPI001E369C81|nr:glycosyltransferase family 8 protein [Shinella sumterensis]
MSPTPALNYGAIACADANMLPAACCALLSIHTNLKAINAKLLLLALGAEEKQLKEIAAFAERHSITIDVLPDPTPRVDGPAFGRWSRATLARLYMDLIVPDTIDRLLYIDADAVAVASLDELFQADLGVKALGAVDDYVMAFPEKIERRQQRIGLKSGGRYFNAGVLLFDWKRSLEDGLIRKARETFEREPERFPSHDQDVLNIAYDGNWHRLDARYNAQTGILPFIKQPAIVHFTGRKKPWQAVMPWAHRRMKAFYRQALEGTAWAPFCKASSLTDNMASFAGHYSTLLTTLSKTGRVRAHFR